MAAWHGRASGGNIGSAYIIISKAWQHKAERGKKRRRQAATGINGGGGIGMKNKHRGVSMAAKTSKHGVAINPSGVACKSIMAKAQQR